MVFDGAIGDAETDFVAWTPGSRSTRTAGLLLGIGALNAASFATGLTELRRTSAPNS